MAKYITVLNSDEDKDYWKAVQSAQTLQEIRANKYYTAGISTSINKTSGADTLVEAKTVTEVSTQTQAGAKIYKLSAQNVDAMLLMSSKPSKSLLKKLNSASK